MMNERIPPLREFLCSDSDTRELLRDLREWVLVGVHPDRDRIRAGLRRVGYRVRCLDSLTDDSTPLPNPIDIVVALTPESAALELVRAATRSRAIVFWLGRDAGDPKLAYEAHRAGLRVIFHRSPVDEYAMHFDDDELGIPE